MILTLSQIFHKLISSQTKKMKYDNIKNRKIKTI